MKLRLHTQKKIFLKVFKIGKFIKSVTVAMNIFVVQTSIEELKKLCK